MGKRDKEHRRKVAARNLRLEQKRKSFKNKFQEEFMKQLELETERVKQSKEIEATEEIKRVNPELEGDMS
jgi:hypothetical protein